ncbi:MAG: MBL fold metallo-hydrolase [Phycisphaerales bacterium]
MKGKIMEDATKIRLLILLSPCLLVMSLTQAEEPIELTKLSEHVYAAVDFDNPSALNSFGANSGVIIGDDAVLVVDTRISAKRAQKFIAAIKKITDKPIKYAVNTHYHLDHSWGNCEFVKLGAIVIGHENGRLAKSKVKSGIKNAGNFGLTPQDMEGTTASVPTVTFKDTLLVDLGGVTVSLSYPGPSHTNDGITALVEQDGVLFTGDILFVRYHPFLGEADIHNWQKILAKLETTTAKIIVPGHGPVSTVADIKDLRIYIEQFDKQAKALCVGKTQNDAPSIAQQLLKALPEQKRTKLTRGVETNLRLKYLSRN